ncbi:hypothetical protein I5F66_23360, partial [Pseudomonas aeruginosa]|nr:hypothetical protein [Pseudomonas aeruginosa]
MVRSISEKLDGGPPRPGAAPRDGRQQGLDVSGMSRHDRDMLRYGLHVVKKFKQ